jgi:hypothetical protein
MTDRRAPTPDELPTPGQLIRSSLIAFGVAAILAVAVVLPAERGHDPTGLGRLSGLTQMGELKVALAAEAAADAEPASAPSAAPSVSDAAPSPPPAEAPVATDQIAVTLQPGQGAEVKLAMTKGARVTYEWATDGPPVNFDTHGDAPGTNYFGYGKGVGVVQDSGEFVAAFDGSHGWFWRNRSPGAVTITRRVSGDFSALKRVL